MIRTAISQGTRANRTGNAAEEVIAAVLNINGIEYIRQRPVGMSIYGHPLRADYYLPTEELIIESKWQEVAGSADEKLPYLVTNIRECYPYPTVLVIGGTGWKAGALAWVRKQTDEYRLVKVLSIEDFMRWCNQGMQR